MLYYKLIILSLAVCLDCRESSYFHTTMLCVFSNIIGGFILLHFNCDNEVPAEGTGYTSSSIISSDSILYSTILHRRPWHCTLR